MITKIILAMFLALATFFSIPNALAYNALSATLIDQAHPLYCAESDSEEKKEATEGEEEPDCD